MRATQVFPMRVTRVRKKINKKGLKGFMGYGQSSLTVAQAAELDLASGLFDGRQHGPL